MTALRSCAQGSQVRSRLQIPRWPAQEPQRRHRCALIAVCETSKILLRSLVDMPTALVCIRNQLEAVRSAFVLAHCISWEEETQQLSLSACVGRADMLQNTTRSALLAHVQAIMEDCATLRTELYVRLLHPTQR